MRMMCMPRLADGSATYLVLSIEVSEGDRVEVGDLLMTVETDKVTAEVCADVAGVVREVLVAVDDEVDVGAPIIDLSGNGG